MSNETILDLEREDESLERVVQGNIAVLIDIVSDLHFLPLPEVQSDRR